MRIAVMAAGAGLRVESRLADMYLPNVEATDEPAKVGTVDLVLFSVKLWDTLEAAQAIKPLLGADTAVVSVQNGVVKDDILRQALGGGHVIGGVCYIAATIAAPGVIRHSGTIHGDTQPFAPEREYEDLAAVAAATSSEPPFVFGHSSGAAIALRAGAVGLPVAGIVAYEAPFANDGAPQPEADPADHIRQLVRSGRDREAVVFWMTDVVRVPEPALAQLDGAPWMTALEPLARTLPYDLAVTAGGVPAAELGKITAPS